MTKKLPEILEHFIYDLVDEDPTFTYKTMFGGYALYRYGKVFSLVISGQLYFKVDENNKQDYINYGSEPFRYKKKSGVVGVMSYYELPEDILENRDELMNWIEKSLQVEGKTVKKKSQKNQELDKKILEYLLTIPKGKVSTYKRVGDYFGVHARKIASVMKYNTEPSIYPCYKIVSESGKLSGYNTSRGVQEKIEKLEKDGIVIKDGKIDKKYFI